jgi:putative oxidoreductase
MRITNLAGRLVVGGYLATHGAQKLFGAFGGKGLDGAAASFAKMGLRPAKPMAALAAVSEFGGGLLTATGAADPLGPIAICGSMLVATAVHRKSGPMSATGGYELPLTNFALAGILATAGGEAFRLTPPLPRRLAAIVAAGAATLTGVALAQILRPEPASAEVATA